MAVQKFVRGKFQMVIINSQKNRENLDYPYSTHEIDFLVGIWQMGNRMINPYRDLSYTSHGDNKQWERRKIVEVKCMEIPISTRILVKVNLILFVEVIN